MIEMRIELVPHVPGDIVGAGMDEVKCRVNMDGQTETLLAEALLAFAHIAAMIGCKKGQSDAHNIEISLAILDGICQEASEIMPSVVHHVQPEESDHGLQ